MAYEVHLSQFQGPLDLLLHLIEKAEMDIKDIFISKITEEYLGYMSQAEALDMDTASEFLTMAATLLYIKSRSLLPRLPQGDDEAEAEEAEDPEAVLIRQLREYKAFKEASGRMEALRAQADGMYTRLPEEFVLPPQEYALLDSDLNSLYEAFLGVLSKGRERVGQPPPKEVVADAYTVRAQLKKIRDVLRARQRVEFAQLLAAAGRAEIIVTFMALMDMLFHNEVAIEQERQYGPITISINRLLEDDADVEYMDE